jgi:hypothetical protein
MSHLKSKWLALLAGALLATGSAFAQDSGPLVDLLVKKGLVTDQEAEELRADLTREAAAAVTSTVSGGKSTSGIAITGRIQAQFNNLATDITGATAQPVYVNHFLLRRVYVGIKAQLYHDFSSTFNYDFAGSTFDAAFITWKQSDRLSVDVGFRKVPIGYDEWLTSSGKLKAIERSTITRYFVESNNGRRLGAGSYRQGVFVNGTDPSGFNYQFAVTNPERNEDGIAGVTSAGNNTNNNFAYWAQAGYAGKSNDSTYVFGASLGYLPDQGGKTLGVGDNLTVVGIYGDYSYGAFSLSGEYYWSNNQHGASATADAHPSGWYLMPTYRIGDKYELVFRAGHIDSDGRGVSLSDGVRSGASGGAMKKEDDYYLGANWYFNSWDTVLQAGYIWGSTKDNLNGTPAKATISGLRGQMQVNF